MPDYFLDERPQQPDRLPEWVDDPIVPDGSSGGGWGGGWGGGGGGGGGGTGGSGGGGGAGGGPGYEDSSAPWHLVGEWGYSQSQILMDADGYVLACGVWVLRGEKACLDVKVECQISNDAAGGHVRCILLSFAIDRIEADANTFRSWFFTGAPVVKGTLRMRAKWQGGHYDYAKVNTVRFRLLGSVISPWMTLSLDRYQDIAEIDVRNGQMIVKSLRLS